MDDVLNHSRQRWQLQLPRGPGVVSQTAGSSRAYEGGMGGIRAGGGQGGPEARCAGDWAASGASRRKSLRRAEIPSARKNPFGAQGPDPKKFWARFRSQTRWIGHFSLAGATSQPELTAIHSDYRTADESLIAML